MFEHRNKALPAQTKQTTSSQSTDRRKKARVHFKQEKHNPTPQGCTHSAQAHSSGCSCPVSGGSSAGICFMGGKGGNGFKYNSAFSNRKFG